ncbi:hypothetical protein C8Q77DRAFT_1138230 [Trametes polyzona]|nr:hypothetical protein C8Q77DRAFT_1138230 [Trametes polyzona]
MTTRRVARLCGLHSRIFGGIAFEPPRAQAAEKPVFRKGSPGLWPTQGPSYRRTNAYHVVPRIVSPAPTSISYGILKVQYAYSLFDLHEDAVTGGNTRSAPQLPRPSLLHTRGALARGHLHRPDTRVCSYACSLWLSSRSCARIASRLLLSSEPLSSRRKERREENHWHRPLSSSVGHCVFRAALNASRAQHRPSLHGTRCAGKDVPGIPVFCKEIPQIESGALSRALRSDPYQTRRQRSSDDAYALIVRACTGPPNVGMVLRHPMQCRRQCT